MQSRLTIFFILIIFSTNCFSQKFIAFETWDVDSLMLILPGQLAEERVNTLNKLAISLSFKDKERSMQYADEAMDLANQLNYEEGIATAYRAYGDIFQYQGNYPKALQNYFDALSIYEQFKKKHKVVSVIYDIAETHFYASNWDKAIEFAYRSLEKCNERLPDGSKVGSLHDSVNISLGIALNYSYKEMESEALKHRLGLLEVMKKNQFSNIEILITTWVTGVNYYRTGEVDSAIAYFSRARSFPDESMNIRAQKYRSLMWFGYLYYSIGETDTAISYLNGTFNWYDKNGFLLWALLASNNLGDFYLGMNDLSGAEDHFLESEKTFNEILSVKSFYRYDSLKYVAVYGTELYAPEPISSRTELMWYEVKFMYRGLYRIYEKKNQTREALKYHILYKNAGDTLNDLRRHRETIELQTKYETEQKEKQIENLIQENEFQSYKLNQTRIFLFGLAGFVILIVLLAIAWIRQNSLKEQKKNLLLQQKLFRSQMNPHFLFNSLASIHNFMINEDSARAASYLTRFSKLIRATLQGSVEDYISLGNEINAIEDYLELQKIRFPGKFEYTIEVDDAFDKETTFIPSMITQPFIENALEHGLKNKLSKGHIWIRFKKNNGKIIIEIEDDGIGRAKAKELLLQQNKDHKSMATSIIEERIRALNKTLKKKITLSILDLENDHGEAVGTRVVLEVPVR